MTVSGITPPNTAVQRRHWPRDLRYRLNYTVRVYGKDFDIKGNSFSLFLRLQPIQLTHQNIKQRRLFRKDSNREKSCRQAGLGHYWLTTRPYTLCVKVAGKSLKALPPVVNVRRKGIFLNLWALPGTDSLNFNKYCFNSRNLMRWQLYDSDPLNKNR